MHVGTMAKQRDYATGTISCAGYSPCCQRGRKRTNKEFDEATKNLLDEYRLTGSMRIRDEIVAMNQGLVLSVASRYERIGELDDLIQEGNIGLIKVVESFDPSREVLFATYAVPVIDGTIRNSLRDKMHTVKIPRHIQDAMVKIEKACNALRQELFHEPSTEEIAHYIEKPLEFVDDVLLHYDAASNIDSLDRRRGAMGEYDPHEAIVNRGADRSGEIVDRVVLQNVMNRRLSRREKKTVMLVLDDVNQTDSARIIGCSRSNVSKLLQKAYGKMRSYMEE